MVGITPDTSYLVVTYQSYNKPDFMLHRKHNYRMRYYISTLCFLSTLLNPAFADFWPPSFTPKRFKGNALLSAGSLGLGSDERVVAFGDFDGDQFLDIVTLDATGRKATVHVWDHNLFVFHDAASFSHTEQILNVVPGDFTFDGTLDLLVMSRGSSPEETKLDLYVGSPHDGFESTPITVPSSGAGQPIPFDVNGDLKIDLLGVTPGSTSLSVWRNVFNGSDPDSSVFSIGDADFDDNPCQISNPHSNAVVDLNGDCLADLFLVCDEQGTSNKFFQIYLNVPSPTSSSPALQLAQLGRLPAGVQTVTFADMDRDGTLDMVFITCTRVDGRTGVGDGCELHVAYNIQTPLCTETENVKGNGCRRPEELCVADPNFKFDLSGTDDEHAYVHFPISDLLPPSRGSDRTPSSLLVFDTRSSPSVPVPLRIGDVNLDGFPDILLVTASPTSSRSYKRTPRLLFAAPCAHSGKSHDNGKGGRTAGCGEDGKGRVGWTVADRDVDALDEVSDTASVTFLDIDEDGTLDILIQRTGEQGQGPFLFVQNNFFFDAFFLKAIVLNGACDNGWCKGRNGTDHYHPFGVSYSGATYKYTILDTTGKRSAAQVAQLPQTAYQSLLTPYAFFGLGRTNNYIENLFVGSTKKVTSEGTPLQSHFDRNIARQTVEQGGNQVHFISMEGVIPNSKVVIYPSNNGGGWRRELYLRPGAWIPWVTVTVVCTVLVLAIVVFVLHVNEKREDELERRRASHHINFDAL